MSANMAWVELEGRICVGQTFLFSVERIFFNGGDQAFYHICTDGAFLDWMFQDDRDFIAGVNRCGICAYG